MKDRYDPHSDIGTPKILEIGKPKLYSKRKFCAGFKADPELWSRFKGGCAERGVSICHVLEALMEAWLVGQKAEATLVRPVTINLTMQHIVERPRRKISYDGPEITRPVGCQGLEHRDWGIGYLGWCRYVKRWVHLEDCGRCPKSR